MSISHLFLVTVLASTVTACGPDLDGQVTQLVIAKNRWLEKGYGNEYLYTYVCRGHCRYRNHEVRVTVLNGKVVAASARNENGSIENVTSISSYPTIPQLLEQILEMLQAQRDGAMTVTARYDSEFGYPTYLRYTQKQVLDGSGEIHIYDLQPAGT